MIPRRILIEPTAFDARVRDFVQTRVPPIVDKVMAPLFPLGMPGGYITISFITAEWLRRRGRGGGPAVVASAWLGWFSQRTAKIIFVRERPRRPRIRRRMDSFPSGHTTGTTAFVLTAAHVLRRERLISARCATLVAVGVPLLMGVYRIIDDEHWATDVIAGWALGAAIAAGCTGLPRGL